jgi:hypothetical protein
MVSFVVGWLAGLYIRRLQLHVRGRLTQQWRAPFRDPSLKFQMPMDHSTWTRRTSNRQE